MFGPLHPSQRMWSIQCIEPLCDQRFPLAVGFNIYLFLFIIFSPEMPFGLNVHPAISNVSTTPISGVGARSRTINTEFLQIPLQIPTY